MFKKILIANRGEIACRIISTAKRMGIETVSVYSDADANAMHVALADQAVHIGPPAASDSYMKMDRIIDAALETGAEAVHPGYGFLSENPEFSEKLEAAGVVFIGPTAGAIRAMGLKDEAKRLMEQAGVPIVPGYHGDNQDEDFLSSEAKKIGYPVLIKARAGGGGKGMRLVESPAEFKTALASAQREGKASFGDAHVLVERYITSPRHIEVQIFGDSFGNVVHLFERDCSLQRRHQKVIEEAPASNMPEDVRKAMTDAATRAAKQINYHGAGTIEFIVDGSGDLRVDGFWFMEMNTRLQVEHPVTEAITGQDLVEWQLRVAAGETLPLSQGQITMNGHAFEARIYAEDPENDFMPAPGVLKYIEFSTQARIDTGVCSGDSVSPFYDPMIAKLTTHKATRHDALAALRNGLKDTICVGTPTNLAFLSKLVADDDFSNAILDTGLIARKQDQLTEVSKPTGFAILAAYVFANDVDVKKDRLGWRQWGAASQSAKFLYNEIVVSSVIRIDGAQNWSVSTDTEEYCYQNIRIDGNCISAKSENENLHAKVVMVDQSVSVKIQGEQFDFHSYNPLDVIEQHGGDTDSITAPLTGVVTAVNVKASDNVKTGDSLLVIEAMKMEHVMVAPRDGVIAEILYNVSDAIDEGVELVRFEGVKQ